MRWLGILVLFLTFRTAFSQDLNYVRYLVDTLCSPTMAGRGYVDDGLENAAVFISAQFDSLGIAPLNNHRYQSFKHPVNTFPGDPVVRLDGRELKPGEHFLINANSPEHSGKYRVLHLDTSCVDHPERIMLRQNVVYLVHPVSAHNRDGMSKRAGLIRELSDHVPVIDPVQKLTWSVGTELFENPVIEVDQQQTDWPGVDSVMIEIRSAFLEKFESQNILGFIEGTDKSNEFVVFTAHYDHLGRMGSAVFPGANDNASGTATLLDLARHYAQNPQQYNLLFIAFAGEEAGLVGSKYFVDNPLVPLDSIRFLINLDLTGNGEDGITVVNGKMFEDDFHDLAAINSAKEFLPKIRARGSAANSDHYWFSKNGVPAFFIYTHGERKSYHDVYDVPETLEFKGYEGLFGLVIEFVKEL